MTLGLPFIALGPTADLAEAAPPALTSGVVNTYQAVSRIAGATLTLDGTSAGAAVPFAVGDRVLLIQMTGSNPAAGSSSLGVYETATVAAVDGPALTLAAPVARSYDPVGQRVQVVRMATATGTTTLTGDVTAPAWNGRTGGVVAFAGGTLDLAGRSIDVTGAGYSTANPAFGAVIVGNRVAAGSSTGRGREGAGVDDDDGGYGGGGTGGAGGEGGTEQNNGGSVGGGGNPGARTVANGTDGGRGNSTTSHSGGGGGGGGILGGGGGAGGGDIVYEAGGGGGGVAGGGGGGAGIGGRDDRAGGGGGGVGSVGNGGTGTSDPRRSLNAGGGGGGGYGGGGGSAGVYPSLADGNGGGGGGSWTGGGAGGLGKRGDDDTQGGSGNAAVTSAVPAAMNFLTRSNARLMPGGAGGAGNAAGGAGGGIVLLDVGQLTGGGSVRAAGAAGANATGREQSGGGGGGGGQVRVTAAITGTAPSFSAVGGPGGAATVTDHGGGVTGAGGGGGGLWLETVGSPTACGATVAGLGVTASVAGGAVPRNVNGRRDAVVASGAGATGLLCSGPPPLFAVGDRVWRDIDADGTQDFGETGYAGLGVTLLDASGASVATTTTDSNGRYVFDGLREGNYRLRFAVPTACAYTVPLAKSDRADDSDVDPFTATTATVTLASGATGLRAPVAGDGVTRAGQINPTVDAGLVCSTSSTTQLGGYSSGPMSDLLPAAAGPFDGARATAVMSQTGTNTSSFLLEISGIDPGVANTMYGSHLHFGPCVAGNGAAAGPHYNTDLVAGNMPVVASPRTEVWLDFTVAANGTSVSSASVPFVPSAAERSIIVHVMPTNPADGTAGARQACLPFTIR